MFWQMILKPDTEYSLRICWMQQLDRQNKTAKGLIHERSESAPHSCKNRYASCDFYFPEIVGSENIYRKVSAGDQVARHQAEDRRPNRIALLIGSAGQQMDRQLAQIDGKFLAGTPKQD